MNILMAVVEEKDDKMSACVDWEWQRILRQSDPFWYAPMKRKPEIPNTDSAKVS